jgi:hypothetical protein
LPKFFKSLPFTNIWRDPLTKNLPRGK